MRGRGIPVPALDPPWPDAQKIAVITSRDAPPGWLGLAHEVVAPWIVAERNQRAFTWAYDAVGWRPPDIEPRATGHIPEMIVLMRR